MESNWVDFKAVKSAVSLQMVLDHYAVNWLRKKDDELRGRCPIHKGEGEGAFHANLAKNAFHCFSCHARGNVLDFVAAMEQCTVRDAALKLSEWFAVLKTEQNGRPLPETRAATNGGEKPTENMPLKFQLRGVDPDHGYLRERGISKETAQLFGVGMFSGKGSMSGRVVIPIHNERGELVAYAGRSLDGSEPRYKLPAGFQKSLELFNLHRAVMENEPQLVVIVEGFFDCLKVYQAGFPAVALMGCSMSEHQEELLASHFRAAWLLLDGDDAGRTAAVEIAARLVRRMFVKVVTLDAGTQPDMMEADGLRMLLK